MANAVNPPRGLRLSQHQSSDDVKTRWYKIASGYNTKIGIGDAITLIADGVANRAAVGGIIAGVAIGFQYTLGGSWSNRNEWVAGTVTDDAYVNVIDDPNAVFEIECDGTFTQTNIGNCADITVADADDFGSKMKLDSSDLGAGTAQLKVLGLADYEGNAFGMDSGAVAEVIINEHFQKQTAGI